MAQSEAFFNWPYKFVNLNPNQLETRRYHLDLAGVRAYATPVALGLVMYLFKEHSDAYIIPFLFGRPSLQTKNRFHLFNRRLHWRLTSNNSFSPELGSLAVQSFALVYSSYLVSIAVMNTGQDYMHVTKAFGHVAASQLPMHYILSIKAWWNPVITWTGWSHERLNVYHRILGRIIYVLLMVHVTMYLNFFVQVGVLRKRLGDLDVRTGLSAFTLLTALVATAYEEVRKVAYHRWFYRTHVVTSFGLVAVLMWHVPNVYTRFYIGQALLFWVLSGMSRAFGRYSCEVDVSCQQVGPGLIEAVGKVNDEWHGRRWANTCWAGMHAYLHQSGLGPKSPFTVVTVEQEQQSSQRSALVKFVVRVLDGPATRLLAGMAKGEESMKMTLEGPLGEAKNYMPILGTPQASQYGVSGKVLVVAGGVGATYAIPVYYNLLAARKNNSTGLKLLWLVKHESDAAWGTEYLRSKNLNLNADIYVTGKQAPGKIGDGSAKGASAFDGLDIGVHRGRSEFPAAVDSFIEQTVNGVNSDDISVMVCGPPALSQSLRNIVGKHVMEKGASVSWYEEQFGMGGS